MAAERSDARVISCFSFPTDISLPTMPTNATPSSRNRPDQAWVRQSLSARVRITFSFLALARALPAAAAHLRRRGVSTRRDPSSCHGCPSPSAAPPTCGTPLDPIVNRPVCLLRADWTLPFTRPRLDDGMRLDCRVTIQIAMIKPTTAFSLSVQRVEPGTQWSTGRCGRLARR